MLGQVPLLQFSRYLQLLAAYTVTVGASCIAHPNNVTNTSNVDISHHAWTGTVMAIQLFLAAVRSLHYYHPCAQPAVLPSLHGVCRCPTCGGAQRGAVVSVHVQASE